MTDQLEQVLFRGVRFKRGKVQRKATTCFNCRGRMKVGEPAFTGRGQKVRNMHILCAEAIAFDDQNEHIMGESNGGA